MPTITVPYHLDEPLPTLPRTGRVIEPDLPPGPLPGRLVALYDAVASEVARQVAAPAQQPVSVASGDCTTSLGVLAGLQRAGVDPAIVWFDAHGDFNTTETTESGYVGGMPLAMAVGRDDLQIAEGLGLAAVDERRVVLLDARDLDAREADLLAHSDLRVIREMRLRAADLPAGPIYLHLDLDVVDPAALPGLRYPAPGGPGVAAVRAAVHEVLSTGRVVAVGLACTWHPEADMGAVTDLALHELDLA